MAKKKKAKKAEVKEQKKAPSKKDNTIKYIVAGVVVVIIIVALILLLRGKKAPEAPVTPTQPVEQQKPTPEKTEKQKIILEQPEEIKYCTEEFAIGWPKNKLETPCIVDGKTVKAKITYSGKGKELEGMWFYITTTSGKVEYLKDTDDLKQGETKEYVIDVGEKIKTLMAVPMSDDKACLNQRLLIIKDTSCVVGK
ncbi:MAG: hypothetical protein QXG86_01405 [Candidatus Woesearchaeota archaeon]